MVSELRKQLYIPVSRSEEGSQGRSELFCVRGVHRSVAKTLDGLRSEGYLQVYPSTVMEKLFLCSEVVSIPVAQVFDHEFTTFQQRAPAPSGGVRKVSTASRASGRAKRGARGRTCKRASR